VLLRMGILLLGGCICLPRSSALGEGWTSTEFWECIYLGIFEDCGSA
jgi:hypothetical protein